MRIVTKNMRKKMNKWKCRPNGTNLSLTQCCPLLPAVFKCLCQSGDGAGPDIAFIVLKRLPQDRSGPAGLQQSRRRVAFGQFSHELQRGVSHLPAHVARTLSDYSSDIWGEGGRHTRSAGCFAEHKNDGASGWIKVRCWGRLELCTLSELLCIRGDVCTQAGPLY